MRVGPARPLLLLALIVIVTVAWPGARSVSSGASGQQAPAAAEAKDGDWTMPGKDYAATRYSGLAQITPANVAGLQPVWTFSTGVLRGHEGQPLVVEQHDVRRDAVSERALRLRSHPGGLSAQVEVPAQPSTPTRSASPAATRSIAARSTPTARSSTTCSTDTPWRWTPRRAASSGTRRSPTSPTARRRRWRRSS